MTGIDPLSTAIAERWADLGRRIDSAASANGRDPADVRVVAVTKGFGVEVVRAARRAGLGRFGESRIQEAEAKILAVPDAEWHLVGHLQSNKARRAVLNFPWIHAIDSLDLLERVEALAGDEGRQPRVLLQVNLTGLPTQHGFGVGELGAGTPGRAALAASLAALRSASVTGLMGIGPQSLDAIASRAAFARLRHLRDDLADTVGRPLPELSMGMSADLESAVAEGATLIRVGTGLFGERPGSG